ncbi:MAG: MFS transporter, partial [Kutzneria sp.]|nr:MFS transporter [Kutzneria sp.]
GGMLVDTFSWPWVFYINLPIGLVALMIIGVALPPVGNRFAREVDYLGSVLLVASVSALLLITTLGGRVYPWTSAPVLGLCVLFAVLLAAFLMWERRATEPVLPLPMLANPVVAVAAASALTVSACFFAANVFLPSYLQIVLGQNATRAGLRLLPMLLPIMLAAAGSGWLVTKTGRYKVYPVVGTALIALAMALFSLLDVDTDWWVLGLDMIVMGLGFGMIRQNLVIAVQNAVDRGQLGTATASTNFFSSLGGAIGLAAFGAIFTAQLGILLPRVPGSVAVDANSLVSSPQRIRQFDPATAAGVAHAVAGSLHVVFLAAFGVAVASVVIVLFLKELPLRGNAPGRGADGGRDAGRGRPAVDTTGTASSDRHEG